MTTLQISPTNTTPAVSTSVHTIVTDAARSQEVLAFRLGDEEYGIALRSVQEIRSYQAPTRLAGASEHLLGVIDLRGEVVPLVDLRRRFGLARADFDALTVIIVVNLGARCVGVVADQVNDVVALRPAQIRQMPSLPACPEQRHMVAMGVVEDRQLVLLDIESLLRSTEMGIVHTAALAD